MQFKPKNKSGTVWPKLAISLRMLTLCAILLIYFHQLPAQHLALSTDGSHSDTQDNQQLNEFLNQLSDVYQIRFVYDSKLVDGKVIKSAPEQKEKKPDQQKNLEQILQEVLTPHALTFEKVYEDYYVIQKKKEEQPVKETLQKMEHSLDRRDTQNEAIKIERMGSRMLSEVKAMVQTISGKVTDGENGDPLPGVNVLAKGTSQGTVTDLNGDYRVSVPDETTALIFSSIGYVSEEVNIEERTSINVTLMPDIQSLSEVVVIGYGAVERRDLTGSVSQVKPEEINAFPVRSIDQALKGRAPGVRVTQNSGRPGARIQIQIRGGNSIIGDNSPLFVVDGFPITGDIDFLNPADIESMDILKDASATAIYGARGANGVVIVTTKKGIKEQNNISIDSYYGVQTVRKRYDMLNARQFAEIANEAALNDGDPLPFDLNNLGDVDTDWQDLIYQAAPIQNHTLSFSGGSAKSQYSISGSLFDQQGTVINTGTTRGNLRLSLDQEANERVKVTTNLALTRSETNSVPADNGHRGNGVLSGAWVSPPTLSPYTADNTFTDVASYAFSPNVLQNPLAFAEITDQSFNTTVLGNIAAEVNIVDGLTFKVLGGTEQYFIEGNYYSPSFLNGTPTGNASTSVTRNISYLNENILNYNKDIGSDDKLTLTAGYTWQQFQGKYNWSGGSGFVNDILENNNLGSAEVTSPNQSNVTEWTLLSWLGRVNYSLNDKYLFTASFRADGSSRFGENHKWGIFPSGAFAWRLSDEPFIENLNLFSDLKFRTSYGITGSTAVSPYQSLNRLSPDRATFGGSDVIGFAPTAIPNPDLRWETTAQFNAGLDFGLMNNRMRMTFDYYRKNTYDLLAQIPLPVSVGFASITRNLGEIRNSGVELSLGYDILVEDFKWNIFGQFSANRNEVIDVGGEDVFGPGISIPFSAPLNLVREGEPLGVFYGFMEDGLDENGQIVYRDLTGDGEITNDDRAIIGNPYPDFIYSLASNFSYRNFELNVFLEGVSGVDVLFATGGSLSNSFNFGENQLVDVYNNRWRPESPDPNAQYPRISKTTTFRISDRFVEDASYLRLQNIRLAYNLPVSSLGINWMTNLQVYVSGQNLITLTNYPGLDPEVNSRGSEGDLRIGIDETAYPTSKTYTFGIRLGF